MSSRTCSDKCHSSAGRWMVGASGILYAGSTATAKQAMKYGAPTFQLLFIRGSVMLLVTLLSMLTLHARGEHPMPVRHWLGVTWSQRRWLLARAVVGTTTVGLNIASLQYLVISDANALNFTWPVFAVLVSFAVLGESVRRLQRMLAPPCPLAPQAAMTAS